MYLQVQTGGVHSETGKNHGFLSGALLAGADRRRGRRDRKTLFYPGLYLKVQTGGVVAETGKYLDF